jgi:hypothetical protein
LRHRIAPEDDPQATAKTPDIEAVVKLVIGENF